MGVSELIAEIGDDKIMMQSVDCSILRVKKSTKHKDTELTIATDQSYLDGGKIGLVLWVSNDDYKAAISRLKDKGDL